MTPTPKPTALKLFKPNLIKSLTKRYSSRNVKSSLYSYVVSAPNSFKAIIFSISMPE